MIRKSTSVLAALCAHALCALVCAAASAAAEENPADWAISSSARRPSDSRSRRSSKVCANLATWMAKTSSSSTDMLREKLIGSRRLRLNWCVSRWTSSSPLAATVTQAAKNATEHHSHRHGAGYRSCWDRVRRQPCPARREHYGTVQHFPGAKRKATGAAQGDRSELSRVARPLESDQTGSRKWLKGARTRRASTWGDSFNPWRYEIRRILRRHFER